MYGLVINGEIKQFYKTLPKTSSTISGLDKLSEDKLRQIWYYKVIWASEPLEEWQSYWKTSYEIWTEYITETKEIINQSLEDFKNKKIKEQSDRTHQEILKEHSLEDQSNKTAEATSIIWWVLWQKRYYTQEELDVLWSYEEQKKWIETKRAEYQTLKWAILEATTYEEVISLIPKIEEVWV